MSHQSENYFDENLKRIAHLDKYLAQTLSTAYRNDYPEIRMAKDGSPVPVVDRRSLHSSYNPSAEAAKWTSMQDLTKDNAIYTVGGLGFAYHLEELLRVLPPERIIVVERDVALMASALAFRPPETFPEDLRFIVGKSPVQAYQTLRNFCNDSEIVFLEHPASNYVYPDYYSTIRGIVNVQEAVGRGGYKILLVSPLYGGSLPVTRYVQRSLNNLGHQCELLDNTVFYPGFEHIGKLTSNKRHTAQLEGLMTILVAETVTAKAIEIQADIVLVMAQGPVTAEVLSELSKADIRTAFWFVEDNTALHYWQAIAPHVDGFFVIQKGEFFDKLKEVGCTNPYYLPMAADPFVHRPLDLTPEELKEYGSDLSHMGAGYHNRREFFTGLLDFDFKIWGSDWENAGLLNRVLQRAGERISTEDAVKIFNATKINVNLHSSTYHSGVNPFGDFLNPRTFEIACCGAFQVVDSRKYLPDSFETGREITVFNDLQEMRDLARDYLNNQDQRIEIATAARERVLREHTYDHRILELLGVIAGRFPEWAPKGGGLPTAEELIREAGDNRELVEVMERFIGRGPLTLEAVAGEIERGEGRLSRTEAMILLLNEFRRWGLEKGVM